MTIISYRQKSRCRIGRSVVFTAGCRFPLLRYHIIGVMNWAHLRTRLRAILIFPLAILRVLNVSLQISDRPAIWAQELRPRFMIVEYWPNALVMPDVGTWCNKKRLAWLAGFSTNGACKGRTRSELTAIDIRHIEHSEEWEEAVSESFFVAVFPRSRSCLWVFTL